MLQASGCMLQAACYRLQATGCMLQASGFIKGNYSIYMIKGLIVINIR
jgi:hypothetical protein